MRWLSRNAHCNSVKLALRGVGGGETATRVALYMCDSCALRPTDLQLIVQLGHNDQRQMCSNNKSGRQTYSW